MIKVLTRNLTINKRDFIVSFKIYDNSIYANIFVEFDDNTDMVYWLTNLYIDIKKYDEKLNIVEEHLKTYWDDFEDEMDLTFDEATFEGLYENIVNRALIVF